MENVYLISSIVIFILAIWLIFFNNTKNDYTHRFKLIKIYPNCDEKIGFIYEPKDWNSSDISDLPTIKVREAL